MEFSRIGDDVVLRLDPGEEIHQSIQSLSNHGIDCAIITSGIGRVRDIQMGYLSADGIYQTLDHEGPMEDSHHKQYGEGPEDHYNPMMR